MPFGGIIKVGSKVAITLSANSSNQRSGILLAGLGADPSRSKSVVVAPAGSDVIRMVANKEGILEIQVHFANALEGGELEVKIGTEPSTPNSVEGHVTWIYSCEP